MADKVRVANPALANPLMDASELEVDPRDRQGASHGRIALAGGFAAHGEPVRLLRDARQRATELWLAGNQLLPEAKVAKELGAKYRS